MKVYNYYYNEFRDVSEEQGIQLVASGVWKQVQDEEDVPKDTAEVKKVGRPKKLEV